MAKRGTKVERSEVNSSEDYEMRYEARKEHTTPKKVEKAKKQSGSNKRSAIEKQLKK